MKALTFGFVLALSVGPIAILIIHNGILYGYNVAIRSALGAAAADFIFAWAAFTGGYAIASRLTEYQATLEFISSIVLIMFGSYMMAPALPIMRKKDKEDPTFHGKGFKVTFILTILNPLTIIAFSAFIGQFSGYPSITSSLVLAIAVFIGSLTVQITLALFASKLKNILYNRKYTTILQIVSGIIISLFGISGFL